MESKTTNTNNQFKMALILMSILVFISIVGNFFQWRNQTTTIINYDGQVDSLLLVRVELEKELATSVYELEKYRGMSVSLDSLLNEASAKIANQEKAIRDLIAKESNSATLNVKLKRELAELKKLKDGYFEQIDQLMAENKELKAQNEILIENVGGLKKEKLVLQSKVLVASQLKIEYLKVTSLKKKGNGKFVESATAKRTNKLELCFTLLENAVAEPGQRMLYAVIKEPSGKVLAGYSKTMFNDIETSEELLATASQKIDYTGIKQNVCLTYENDQRILTSGVYIYHIYVDGTLVGETTSVLK